MNIELARRAVACKHWRWMAGMALSLNGSRRRVCTIGVEGIQFDSGWASLLDLQTNQTALPDLTDPATLGCLLALVREAWNDSRTNTLPTTDGGWAVADGDDDWICTGAIEAAALVAALEAAP